MGKYSAEIFVGMDVSDKNVEIFVLKGAREDGEGAKIVNSHESLSEFARIFHEPSKVKIALETGAHSTWMAEQLIEDGFSVVVADARQLRMIWKSEKKSDARDAEMLARILRADPKLLGAVSLKDKTSRASLALIKARDCLVKTRTKIINTVRGVLKSEGILSSAITVDNFGKNVLEIVPEELFSALAGLVAEVRNIESLIRDYDKKTAALCRDSEPCKRVSQIKGVGPLTSAIFVLTIEDAERFKSGQRLASYLGLVPRRDQSGETDKQLPITKSGSKILRWTLIQAANYILGPFGDKDCDLRKFGERIASRGGKNSRKKAKVAVARKLAVLMLKLWKTGEKYDPQHSQRKKSAAKKAA